MFFMKTVSPAKNDKTSQQLKKQAIAEGVKAAKQKLAAAKAEVVAAKQALANAKRPAEPVSAEATAEAVKVAKKNLEIAKQNVMVAELNVQRAKKPGVPLKDNIFKRFWKTKFLFLLFLPALIYYVVFKYIPMWGISISFFDYRLLKGLAGSEFVGFRNFEAFFRNPDFWPMLWNTIILSLQGLFISFPITVLFSLLLNEVRNQRFKKITQTISYMPHFLSTVIVCALVKNLLDPTTGAVNSIIKALGNDPIYFMMEPSMFRPIYLISGIWQGLGWGTIVYLAAISSVDPGLYEAARLDGAGRWRQMASITLPSIAPTVATMFILSVGHVLDANLEKCLLLQTGTNIDVSQTIATYIFSLGMNTTNGQAMSTAVGLFKNLVDLALLAVANFASKKVTETSVF